MNHRIRRIAVLLLAAALAPQSASAGLISESEVALTAFTSFDTQGVPAVTDFDDTIDGLGSVLALTRATNQTMPFPNIPTSQTTAFASSAGTTVGVFGVGVNGFFFQNALPPNELLASGTFSQTLTNTSTVPNSVTPVVVDFFVPNPTIQFFGVGNSFPVGADPARDVLATVSIVMRTTLTHPNGSFIEDVVLDYGMGVMRPTPEGVLTAVPFPDVTGPIPTFEEPDGSFGWRLPALFVNDMPLGDLGPGDVLEFSYEYSAFASTGFGETGIFAAIGDPFDLSAGGGRVELEVIPEPATLTLLAAGLVALRLGGRARA